jgi:hypothetical protein
MLSGHLRWVTLEKTAMSDVDLEDLWIEDMAFQLTVSA